MPEPKKYSSPLRQTQVRLTQQTIMQAMAAALIDEGEGGDAVTVIARIANISERTLYRHYPTKEDLWNAFLDWLSEHVGLEQLPATTEELLEAVPVMFGRFEENDKLLRVCLSTRPWSAVWINGRQGWKQSIEQCLAASFEDVDSNRLRTAGSVIQLIFSGISWKSMRDHWGLSAEEAVKATDWALRTVFDGLGQETARSAAADGLSGKRR